MQAPYYPIIYVRGYAMSESERDETAADPFCGFNVGSTVYRAAIDKNAAPKRFICVDDSSAARCGLVAAVLPAAPIA